MLSLIKERLSIQMSCVFTSATLAPRAALHTLGWVQQKVICMGTLHSLMHEPGREMDRALQGKGQDRLLSLFPTEETANLEIQVRNLSGDDTVSPMYPPATLGDVTWQQSS